MCQKQCRDENGFKCHCEGEGHKRMMMLFAENPEQFVSNFSEEFDRAFMELVRRRYRNMRVRANVVYAEYISDRDHVHMNATVWTTLTEYVRHLERTGQCQVEDSPDGLFITYTGDEEERRRTGVLRSVRQLVASNQRRIDAAFDARRAAEQRLLGGRPESKPADMVRRGDERITLAIPAPSDAEAARTRQPRQTLELTEADDGTAVAPRRKDDLDGVFEQLERRREADRRKRTAGHRNDSGNASAGGGAGSSESDGDSDDTRVHRHRHHHRNKKSRSRSRSRSRSLSDSGEHHRHHHHHSRSRDRRSSRDGSSTRCRDETGRNTRDEQSAHRNRKSNDKAQRSHHSAAATEKIRDASPSRNTGEASGCGAIDDATASQREKNGSDETKQDTPKAKKSETNKGTVESMNDDVEEEEEEEPWLMKGIVVRVLSKISDGKYYRAKGVVTRLSGEYACCVRVAEPRATLLLDQADLETVVPALGGRVAVLRGPFRGAEGVLEALDTAEYTARVRVGDDVLTLPYEDFSKLGDEQSVPPKQR